MAPAACAFVAFISKAQAPLNATAIFPANAAPLTRSLQPKESAAVPSSTSTKLPQTPLGTFPQLAVNAKTFRVVSPKGVVTTTV